MNKWFKSGSPWVWLNAGAVAVCLILVVGLLTLIAARGLGHFWPGAVMVADYPLSGEHSQRIAGEIVDSETVPKARLQAVGLSVDTLPEVVTRELWQVGNKDLQGRDFVWVVKPWLTNRHYPQHIVTLERRAWGNFYGYLQNVKEDGRVVASGEKAWLSLQSRLSRVLAIYSQIGYLEKHGISAINAELEALRLKRRALMLDNALTPDSEKQIKTQEVTAQRRSEQLGDQLAELHSALARDRFTAITVDGLVIEQSVSTIVRAYRPNAMSLTEKLYFYGDKLGEFLSADPREANTEGGVFPAIFGTIILVILMSVIVTPFGIVAAVYLREYASQGIVTRMIRIAVNNLAGVPAIVYGVFGLGFFIYFLGGNIDQLFFPEALPSPTFGTPGLLWAALTLSILTLPTVIVATEEGLARIPASVREGSLALGATKAETLWHVVLPMASPAMMTGLILAIARAAGEVAPLMLVGVVKLAPTLPVDGNYPFLHLDQKFMHLGFHIYDVGFQSPNVDAARPLVYATALLLIIIIATLNLTAVALRNHLREKYKSLDV